MYLPFNSVHDVLDRLHAASPASVRWLLLVADRHSEAISDLLTVAADRGMECSGGLFPGLIDGSKGRGEGLVAIPLPEGSRVHLASVTRDSVNWHDPSPKLSDEQAASALLFVDCQSPGIDGFLETIYDRYGTAIHYAGAGAGYSDLRRQPVIFDSSGFIEHGGLLVLLPLRSTASVRHGWRRVAGPFVATRSDGNVIQELNWEPAGSFYRSQIEFLAPELKDRPVFPDINTRFPLGIGKQSAEDVVRDPIEITAEDEIVVLSDVPENSAIYISEGSKDSLIEAACHAVGECQSVGDISSCFVSDCYSRALMLGEDLEKELEAVDTVLKRFTDKPAEGVLALGEICGNGRSSLEFYNKTFVFAVTHR